MTGYLDIIGAAKALAKKVGIYQGGFNEELDKFMKASCNTKVGIFQGVDNEKTDGITLHEYIEADEVDEKTR